jgi:hypothetical protein
MADDNFENKQRYFSPMPDITPVLWNSAVDAAIRAVESGKPRSVALVVGIAVIKKNARCPFDNESARRLLGEEIEKRLGKAEDIKATELSPPEVTNRVDDPKRARLAGGSSRSFHWKTLTFGFAAGVVIGFLIAQLFRQRFQIHAGPGGTVVRIDTWTGNSWIMTVRNQAGNSWIMTPRDAEQGSPEWRPVN